MTAPSDDSPVYTWEIVDDVAVSFATPGDIPEDVWALYLADLRAHHSRFILALSTGTNSINATQRKAVAEILNDQEILAIVVSDSALTRGIVTAVSWLGARTKSYGWNQLDEALKNLPTSKESADHIRQLAQEFQKRIAK